VNDKDIKRIEAHLKRTFGTANLNLKARPRQKDSAEAYIGEEFVGVVYQDEDELQRSLGYGRKDHRLDLIRAAHGLRVQEVPALKARARIQNWVGGDSNRPSTTRTTLVARKNSQIICTLGEYGKPSQKLVK